MKWHVIYIYIYVYFRLSYDSITLFLYYRTIRNRWFSHARLTSTKLSCPVTQRAVMYSPQLKAEACKRASMLQSMKTV